MPLPPFKLPTAESSTSALARSSKNKKNISGNVSQSSIFDLKGLVSEHQSTFQKEGREAVKGEAGARRGRIGELVSVSGEACKSKDRFSRPSPNLAKRLAQQAENDTKRARIYDDQERITEHERQEIMRLKAERYEKLRRGEEAPSKESAIDFDRKQEEEEGYDHWSDHASNVDESALVPDHLRHFPPQPEYDENDNEEVEYVDEMGRTRKGTRREAREAETAKASGDTRGNGNEVRRGENQVAGEGSAGGVGVAHAEVLQSNVIYGEQSFFPVYEPTQEELKARYKVAEGGPMVDHYDAKKEVRTKGAGFYQFAQDEEVRRRQMEELKQQRDETEQARAGSNSRGGADEPAAPVLSAAQEAKKRKLDERRALIEAKRQKMLGGKEAVEQKKKEIQDRAVDALLRSVEQEMEGEKP